MQRVLTAIGRIGRRSDRMFFTPDLPISLALTGACGVFLLVMVSSLLMALFRPLYRSPSLLHPPELAGLILLAALLFRVGPVGGIVLLLSEAALVSILRFVPGGLLLSVALAGYGLVLFGRYSWARAPGLHQGVQLRRLARPLGKGWKAYLPATPQAQHQARVLVSPGGQAFFLGTVRGRSMRKYGQDQIGWSGLVDARLRELHLADDPLIRQAQKVLWVTRPRRATGHYPTTAADGVSTVIGTPAELAAQLQAWAGMVAQLEAPEARPLTPAEEGRRVEEQALQDVQARLPAGWSIRTGLLLARGGDADIELTSPEGERYVVDVKARTDRMDLKAPRGGRVKSWPEIHKQVSQAARQLKGTPVVWQPRTRDEDFHLVAGVWCLRGDAPALLSALAALATSAAVQEASPHEVLGVPPGASREEIQAAYKALAKQYHPDRVASLGVEFRGLAERRMQAINAAYKLLND